MAIGLIFGGAVGNLIDRARFGAVVDFVDVHWRGWHWPAFNVADSAITRRRRAARAAPHERALDRGARLASCNAVSLVVDAADAGERLDRWLAARVPGVSRARLQALIAGDHVRVDGAARKPSHRVVAGERVEVEIPPLPPEELEPEPIALSVVHEDEHVLVLDKPAGIVVHPGAGHTRGTLAAAVLAHAPGTAGVGGRADPGSCIAWTRTPRACS